MNILKTSKENIITLSLIITLIIGTFLRFKGLTFQSHWADELFAASTSMPKNSFWTMYQLTVNDVNPPLYQTILWIWYHIFGFTEYAGRSLVALFGSLGIFAVYLLGKEFFNKEVGLYAAMIVATNQFLIFHSQDIRAYSFFFLLTTMSYLYLMKVINNYSKQNYFLYLLFTLAMVYTHYFSFFVLATQVFVFVFYFTKKNRKRLFTLASITAVVITASLLPLAQYILTTADIQETWIPKPSTLFLIKYINTYVKSYSLEITFLILVSFSIFYLFHKRENSRYKNAVIVLLLWIVIGYLFPYIRSITSTPLLVPRYTIYIIPAWILLISFGIFLLRYSTLKVASVIIIIVLSLYQLYDSHYYTVVKKEQWRDILFDIDRSHSKLPVYDLHNWYNSYPTYIKMLELDIDIRSKSLLELQSVNKTQPSCFFVLYAHHNANRNNPKPKFLQGDNIVKVLDIYKKGALAILYANNVKPELCSELYDGTVVQK